MLANLRIYFQEILRLLLVIPFAIIYSSLIGLWKTLKKPNSYFIGFGPLPINLNHALAVRSVNGRAESFVTHMYSIGGDVDVKLFSKSRLTNFVIRFLCIPYFFSITRYTHVFFYFDGGALGNGSFFLWRLEALLHKLAGVKTIVSAYGSDVHSTRIMTNLSLKHGYSLDYPNQWLRNHTIESRIKYWCRKADYVLAGADWVDYLPRWDRLVSSHFTLNVRSVLNVELKDNVSTLHILHAPNHRHLKGSDAIEFAVNNLIEEGLDIELTLLSGVPNTRVLEEIARHDLVIDQLIIGWYAQFALEAIANGVPTICYLSENYLELYKDIFASKGQEIPFISATQENLTDVLRFCYFNRDSLSDLREKGRSFASALHSLEAIGNLFEEIVSSIPN